MRNELVQGPPPLTETYSPHTHLPTTGEQLPSLVPIPEGAVLDAGEPGSRSPAAEPAKALTDSSVARPEADRALPCRNSVLPPSGDPPDKTQ